MTEKSVRKRLEWNYTRHNNPKKILLSRLVPGAILMIMGVVLKVAIGGSIGAFSMVFFALGQYIILSLQIKSYWADKASRFDIREKYITDRWIKRANGNYSYFSSYEFSKIDKIYDEYEYGREMILDNSGWPGFHYADEYKFKKNKEHTYIHNVNNWRWARPEEIEKHGLDAYTARILLEKEDDKYQKISQ